MDGAPAGFEAWCRRCYLPIAYADDASACDTCTYTVCQGCLPLHSPVRCDDCRWTTALVSSPPLLGLRQSLSPSATPLPESDMSQVLPPPLRLCFKDGVREVVPNTTVPRVEWEKAHPIRRARLSLLATITTGAASARAAAWRLFATFLELVRVPLDSVYPSDVADFVVWRVAPPESVTTPARGPVLAATAMSDLARLRAHALSLALDVHRHLYGPPITAVLKALGSSDKHDSVRKTPVAVRDIHRLVDQACAPGADIAFMRSVFIVTLGFFFFCRGGELDVRRQHLVASRSTISFTFTHQKPRGTPVVAARPVTRSCAAPVLRRMYDRYLPFMPKSPDAPVGADSSGTPPSSASVRAMLLALLGTPPILPGEDSSLPWSLRAGAATMCFQSGIPIDRIMRLGRWSSEVALMYCVLTPSVQDRLWQPVADAGWYA